MSRRLKHKEEQKKVYSIQITDEQIKTIRSLYLRVEQTWIHHGVAEMIDETGKVERDTFCECRFCGKASYENAASIVHEQECIIPLADKEFKELNTQFIEVLGKVNQ